jgi:hypothetical protein
MPIHSSKRPRDANQLAKPIVDIATGEAIDRAKEEKPNNPAPVLLGRRSEIARKAAQARHGKKL